MQMQKRKQQTRILSSCRQRIEKSEMIFSSVQQLAKNDLGWNCTIFHWSCSSLSRDLPLSPTVPPAAGNYNSHETATALTVNINMASVSQTKANQFLPWNEIKLGEGSGRVGRRPVSLVHVWWRGLKGTDANTAGFRWINAAVHGGPALARSGKSNDKKDVISRHLSGDSCIHMHVALRAEMSSVPLRSLVCTYAGIGLWRRNACNCATTGTNSCFDAHFLCFRFLL